MDFFYLTAEGAERGSGRMGEWERGRGGEWHSSFVGIEEIQILYSC
jgi:hypothetical protein